MTRFRHILPRFALFPLLFLAACASFPVERTFDNPEMRRLQAESLVDVPDYPIAGQSIDEFFSRKVAFIESDAGASGRAAPISRDGYFLTAAHVIDDGPFYFTNLVILKTIPSPLTQSGSVLPNEYFLIENLPGRAVWSDKKSDLAIIHFDHRSPEYFQKMTDNIPEGTPVFAGSNEGILFTEQNVEDGVGNGPFETAGHVVAVKNARGDLPFTTYQSTLVGRGGMSGTPVVDDQGQLVGILTGLLQTIHWNLKLETKARFSMIDPSLIQSIIARDREQSPTS
ncbi:MAG: serine protease [Verrucomicrobiota bacterium]